LSFRGDWICCTLLDLSDSWRSW